jgi:hypothetical protein
MPAGYLEGAVQDRDAIRDFFVGTAELIWPFACALFSAGKNAFHIVA